MSVPLNFRHTHTRPRWSSEDGVSLIEVSAVMVIVAIGAFMAVPAFSNWVANSQLRSAMTDITSMLAFGRTAAMNQNATTTVSLAMVGGKVQVSTNGLLPPSTMGVHVTGFSGGPVSFSSLGLRAGGGTANQLLTVTNSRGVIHSVVVTPGGKIDWCRKPTCP